MLRHGNGNLVERNIFLGKGVADTGGVRVINRDQIVRGNYFEDLAGTSFKKRDQRDERRAQFGDQPLSSSRERADRGQ